MRKVIKTNGGFTLVELLAVIVILGLLMAIAIPSVTKYITQSRVKTLISSMDSYVTAVVTSVNNGEYKFSDSTKVFAIPIECISLEKGGTNPFGNWYQANSSYWAYVLIHYDNVGYTYEYGFTFKDDAGYGLYPTINSKIENHMVKTGYDDLTQPKDGLAKDFVSLNKWEGFSNVTETTELVVLEAENEGIEGDGQNTCTLCQKGENYEQVEYEKEQAKIDEEEKYLNETVAYAIYSDSDNSLTFVRSKNEIKAGDVYDGKNVTNVYSGFENIASSPWKSVANNVKKVVFKDLIRPVDTKNWFENFSNCSYFDVANLDTSNVTSMYRMFYNVGSKVSELKLNLSNFNTSKVTNMISMFQNIGANASIVELNLTGWDTSNVTSMSNMFQTAAYNSTYFKVIGMDNWNISKVTSLHWMFADAGQNATTFSIGDLSNWNTSSVTSMYATFCRAGEKAKDWSIGNLSNWNTSKVTNMEGMFSGAGFNALNFNLGNLNNWDTSSVTDMSAMFHESGYNSTTYNIGDLSKWDVSNVKDMSKMFYYVGYKSSTLKIGDLSNWNTGNVINMWCMFMYAGNSATWMLDLSGWNVNNVTSYSSFNYGITSKVTAPNWVN